jgi:hypothetical protein
MRLIRSVTFVVLLVAVVGSIGPAISAAADVAPSDDIASAPALTLPLTVSVDTTGATSSPDDPPFFSGLGLPTLWYVFTATEPTGVRISTIDSDYEAPACAFTGTPGSLTLVDCNSPADSIDLTFSADAGVTYYIGIEGAVAGEDGPMLVLSAETTVIHPPLEVAVTIDAVAKIDPRTGEATITGEIACSREPDLTGQNSIFVTLTQTRGHVDVSGSQEAALDCTTGAWTATISAESGRFHPGRAVVEQASAKVWDGIEGHFAFGSAGPLSVRLRPITASGGTPR